MDSENECLRTIAVLVKVPSNWEDRLDMQQVIEREIREDRWYWNWPDPLAEEVTFDVEIDGHTYGLRPEAARIVKEAMRDAGRYRWLRDLRGYVTGPQAVNISMDINGAGSAASLGTFYSILQGDVLDSAIDAAMAKGGA